MDCSPRVSEVLYVGLCRHIGTPTEVTIRRELSDMEEIIRHSVEVYEGELYMYSGSHREGFRFNSSDRDLMFWCIRYHIICDMSSFDAFFPYTILLQDSFTPPGFVRLKLLTPGRNLRILCSIVNYMNDCYLSSEKFRYTMYFGLTKSRILTEKLRQHGPCSSFYSGGIENDYGVCMACRHWPRTAQPWIDRCQIKQWPNQTLLKEVLSKGCHVMPIGSNLIDDESELEWRLSFSLAEQKLVYSFNHTQFLCYGMLKFFLKEVLSSETQESLICSYFMKTILFWEIQNNPDDAFWCPSNLLTCFWVCFKRLCKCVCDAFCPNFFIQENNMFKSKVIGASREVLLSKFIIYYEMGVTCLMQSTTLNSILEQAFCNPNFSLPFTEGHILPLANMDVSINTQLLATHYLMTSQEECYLALKTISNQLKLKLSQVQSLALQYAMSDILFQTGFILANCSTSNRNKAWYKTDRMAINMLRLSSRIGPLSQVLCLGVYFYNTGRYNKVQDILKIFKQRFSQPFVLFDDRDKDKQLYIENIGKYPLGERMKKAWVNNIFFPISYLSEFDLEHSMCRENILDPLIPLHISFHMLNVLSNHKQGNRSQCLQSLTDLKTLLLYDDGRYVDSDTRDISWQILGICQHVVGDLHGALQSYQQSIRQKPYHKLHRASVTRIRLVLHQLIV